MNKETLLELAVKWERDSREPNAMDGSPEAEKQNLIDRGIREGKRECADMLRSLVSLLN